MFWLTLDVETIPGQSDEARAIARAETRAPGTLKKPESIEAWWAEHGEAAVEENWRKQALDAALGELCCLGFAIGEDGQAQAIVRAPDEAEGEFVRRCLKAADKALMDIDHWHEARRPFVVGHNVSFDLGFLRARCWANRIAPPRWLPSADARAGRDYGDTMTQFAGFGGRIALSKLCACLGLPDPKEQGDGRDVFDLWRSGEHEALARYCQADVEATRAAWMIMTGLEPLEVVEEGRW
jgi:hypothetical protein